MNIKYLFQDYLRVKTHSCVGCSLTNWVEKIYQNSNHIEYYFLPRLVFITFMILLATPLHLYEKIRYEEKIKQSQPKNPLFIIGYYRSGTTFLHYLLGQDHNLAYPTTADVINPNTFLGSEQIVNLLTNFVLPETRPMDNLQMDSSLPFEEEFALANTSQLSLCNGYFFPKTIKDVFDKCVLLQDEAIKKQWQDNFKYFLQKLTLKYPHQTMLLKTPANTARVKEILEIYPDAKFIHIYRNPYQVYLSNERLYEKILPILSFEKVDNQTIENFIFYSYQKTYQKFLAEKHLIKDNNLVEIKYEDLVKYPLNTLRHIYQTINPEDFEQVLPYFESFLKKYENYQTNTYNLEPLMAKKIKESWYEMFNAFNYES